MFGRCRELRRNYPKKSTIVRLIPYVVESSSPAFDLFPSPRHKHALRPILFSCATNLGAHDLEKQCRRGFTILLLIFKSRRDTIFCAIKYDLLKGRKRGPFVFFSRNSKTWVTIVRPQISGKFSKK